MHIISPRLDALNFLTNQNSTKKLFLKCNLCIYFIIAWNIYIIADSSVSTLYPSDISIIDWIEHILMTWMAASHRPIYLSSYHLHSKGNIAILSTKIAKIDMVHTLIPIYIKKFQCILDVRQISLELSLLFLHNPYFINYFHILYHRSFCFGDHCPPKWAEENLQIFWGLGGLIPTILFADNCFSATIKELCKCRFLPCNNRLHFFYILISS